MAGLQLKKLNKFNWKFGTWIYIKAKSLIINLRESYWTLALCCSSSHSVTLFRQFVTCVNYQMDSFNLLPTFAGPISLYATKPYTVFYLYKQRRRMVVHVQVRSGIMKWKQEKNIENSPNKNTSTIQHNILNYSFKSSFCVVWCRLMHSGVMLWSFPFSLF